MPKNPFEQPVEQPLKKLAFSGELKEPEDETPEEKEARLAIRAKISAKLEEARAALEAEQDEVKKIELRRDIKTLWGLEGALNFAGTDPLALLRSEEEDLKKAEGELKKLKPKIFDSFATKDLKESGRHFAQGDKDHAEDSIRLLKEAMEGYL